MFLEVSERYPGHVFAHEYLAKCYAKLDPVKYKNEIEKIKKLQNSTCQRMMMDFGQRLMITLKKIKMDT